jgi:hypothetical protein
LTWLQGLCAGLPAIYTAYEMSEDPNNDPKRQLIELYGLIGEILSGGPLYREYTYTTRAGYLTGTHGSRYSQLPQFRMYCSNTMCRHETWWATTERDIYFRSEDYVNARTFKCQNCRQNEVEYFFIWHAREVDTVFIKVGQYPAMEERVSEALNGALNKEDLQMYKNALRMRNFNLGLAAVAYLRRVVENKINDILEILHESAISHNAPEEVLKRHDEMKNDRRFSVKVDYAGDLLPVSLRPRGLPNPMAVLHDLASDGLHARSDEECVAIFDKCRATFEYVFGRVRIETEEAKRFVKSMVELSGNKSAAVKAKL